MRRPYLFAGWLWYLGTLVPVIGLVQVGSQAHADRYTYLPQIGLLVALVWAAGEVFERRRELMPTAIALGCGVLVALGIGTWLQSGHWRSSDALYQHAVDVEPRGWLAWNNLGNQQLGRGELDRARRCFEEALRLFPGYSAAHYNLGNVHLRALEREQAIAAYQRALELDDSNLDAWNNLGVAYLNLQRYGEALAQFETALRLAPRHADALENLATACALKGDRARAEDACRRLAEVDAGRAANLRQQFDLVR